MSKHTDGEWIVEGRTVYSLEHHGWYKGVEQFKNRFYASVQGPGAGEEELEANAKLMASAPELLAALKEVKGMLYTLDMTGTPVGLQVSAAIAKALGEDV